MKKKKIIILAYILISLLHLLITSEVLMCAKPTAGHDDALFIRLSHSIIIGDYLGHYDNKTLAKSPSYAFWIALCHILGVPLLFGQKLLYMFSCGIIVLALRKFISNNFLLLLIYSLLLFNPAIYSTEMLRVYRSSIHPSLTLLLFGGIINFYIYEPSLKIKSLCGWGTFTGIVLAAFWLNREEAIWILPPLFIIISFSFWRLYKANYPNKCLLTACYISPIVIFLMILLTICTINYFKYDNFTYCEIKSQEFQAAVNSLQQIEHNRIPFVPLSRTAFSFAFKASPVFSEIKKPMEEMLFKKWSFFSEKAVNTPSGEIAGGWFHWALRDAVQSVGYYSSGAKAKDYYKRLSDDINRAFADGRLVQSNYLGKNVLWLTVKNLPEVIMKTVTFNGCDAENFYSDEPFAGVYVFETITGSRMAPIIELSNLSLADNYIRIRHDVWLVYKTIFPWLVMLGVICFLISVIQDICFHRLMNLNVLCIAIIVGIGCLFIGLCFITAIFGAGITILYLSPAQPLLIIFALLSCYNVIHLFFCIRDMKKR